MTAAPDIITGGCLCGAVRFEARSAPIIVRKCWCRDCQYWSAGSATVNVAFASADVTITGDLQTFESTADSGNRMLRSFCPACGTPVTTAAASRPHVLMLRAGTLDDTSLARPTVEIWTASAPASAVFDPQTTRFERQPPPVG